MPKLHNILYDNAAPTLASPFSSPELPAGELVFAKPGCWGTKASRSPACLRVVLAALASVAAIAVLVFLCSRSYRRRAVQDIEGRRLASSGASGGLDDACTVSKDEEEHEQGRSPQHPRFPGDDDWKLPFKKRWMVRAAGSGASDARRSPQQPGQQPHHHESAGAPSHASQSQDSRKPKERGLPSLASRPSTSAPERTPPQNDAPTLRPGLRPRRRAPETRTSNVRQTTLQKKRKGRQTQRGPQRQQSKVQRDRRQQQVLPEQQQQQQERRLPHRHEQKKALQTQQQQDKGQKPLHLQEMQPPDQQQAVQDQDQHQAMEHGAQQATPNEGNEQKSGKRKREQKDQEGLDQDGEQQQTMQQQEQQTASQGEGDEQGGKRQRKEEHQQETEQVVEEKQQQVQQSADRPSTFLPEAWIEPVSPPEPEPSEANTSQQPLQPSPTNVPFMPKGLNTQAPAGSSPTLFEALSAAAKGLRVASVLIPAVGPSSSKDEAATASETAGASAARAQTGSELPHSGLPLAARTTTEGSLSSTMPALSSVLVDGRLQGAGTATETPAAGPSGSAVVANPTITKLLGAPEFTTDGEREHPYVRLPKAVVGKNTKSLHIDLKTAVTIHYGRRDVIPLLVRSHELLCRKFLIPGQLMELGFIVKDLIAHAVRYQHYNLHEHATVRAAERLGLRFLLMDTVVSYMMIVGQTPDPVYWKMFTDSVGHVAPPVTTWGNAGKASPSSFLGQELSRAIQMLKRGERPLPAHMLKLKRLLFCWEHSPMLFRKEDFDPWRRDDLDSTDGD